MAVRVVYLDVAINDLTAIYEYISFDSVKYAKLEVKKIKEYIDSLRNYPLKGRPYKTLKDKIIRTIVYKHYIIFYIASDTQISVLTIHHHSRSLENNPALNI